MYTCIKRTSKLFWGVLSKHLHEFLTRSVWPNYSMLERLLVPRWSLNALQIGGISRCSFQWGLWLNQASFYQLLYVRPFRCWVVLQKPYQNYSNIVLCYVLPIEWFRLRPSYSKLVRHMLERRGGRRWSRSALRTGVTWWCSLERRLNSKLNRPIGSLLFLANVHLPPTLKE